MSHPSVFSSRRGSAAADEHQTMSHVTPTGSSSPGPYHAPPPHSLVIHPQTQSVGAQVKKKSGFQITSVLPAQVSASGNNSIADDTESYDDMDESHTEDLSSSDILDVSVSRATDAGVPERSSSEETLNSLHGGETPGVVSPNEPVMHHAQQGYVVNGVHHHAHHHHGHHRTAQGRSAVTSSGPVTQGKVPDGHPVQAAVVESSGPPAPSHITAPAPVTGAAPDGGATKGPAGSAAPPVQPVSHAQSSAASTASRFRVVKLDSNSEPFRKGRWTCTEFYEKDGTSVDVAPAHRTVENIIHSEHETTSGSSSGSTLSGGGDVQQTCSGPAPAQLNAHPPDPGSHSVFQPVTPQAVFVTGVLASDGSSGPIRPQQPAAAYAAEQVQSSYPTNPKPPMSVGPCGMSPLEYAQIGANVQSASQQLQIPPIRSAVSPRGAQMSVGMVPVAHSVSPRLQAPVSQVHLDQQQTGAQLTLSTASGSSVQSGLHMATHSVQGQQGGRVPPAGLSYSGVTASQLEDAQRLLLQHHPLLSLPRLTAGGLAGSTFGPGADAAFAVTTGADEDSSSGASVVAIDNKIEQAMDLVKSHLMYAVREEVEVLKEQIKELIERNSQLEQENTLLKNLASPEQLAQFQAQVQAGSPAAGPPQNLPPNLGPGSTA